MKKIWKRIRIICSIYFLLSLWFLNREIASNEKEELKNKLNISLSQIKEKEENERQIKLKLEFSQFFFLIFDVLIYDELLIETTIIQLKNFMMRQKIIWLN